MYDDVLIPGDMELFHPPSCPTNFYGGNIRGHLSADSAPMEIVYCINNSNNCSDLPTRIWTFVTFLISKLKPPNLVTSPKIYLGKKLPWQIREYLV